MITIILALLLMPFNLLARDVQIMSIEKKVLSNGLTILVKSNHTIPKVSMQLWFNVGSKDEKTGQKGLAHLIEHMVFKGTEKLSESDINVIVHKLSGDCNAFTSYDYTGYKFNMPSHHWRQMVPIMADCMVHATFKDEHLNSEMKAVIQELKMIRDNHTRQLIYDLLTVVFPDHPYHYPLIGYKDDLWSVRGDDLKQFYKKHYLPNNAVFVVVGDVDPQEVFALAEQSFGNIPADYTYKKEVFYHNSDIGATLLKLYRDIQQPIAMAAFAIPGAKALKAHITDVLFLLLGNGKDSRLHKRLVDQEKLVTYVSISSIDLFDHGLFAIVYMPVNVDQVPAIERIINEEIQDIINNGIGSDELQKALNKAKMYEYDLLESNEMQAYLIGQYYLATGDPNYAFTYLNRDKQDFAQEIPEFCKRYFRPTIMHSGLILPLANESEKKEWLALQEQSDAKDKEILSARQRTQTVEPPRYAQTIKVQSATDFNFPKAHSKQFGNGLTLLWYNNPITPKINIMLELKAKSYCDPQDKQGLFNFVARMMYEGTQHYTAQEFSRALESRGISLAIEAGFVTLSCLREDMSYALGLLREVLVECVFPEDNIIKVRNQLFSSCKLFWDSPWQVAGQLTSELIYKNHPYSKNSIGSLQSLENITQEDLKKFYHSNVVPSGAVMAIVGDLQGVDVPNVFGHYFASWSGPKVIEPEFPVIVHEQKEEVNFAMNRDQVVLMLSLPSIDRFHKDYDKLVLFDQILSGGGLNSKLMELREHTGLFYTISGSTIAGSGLHQGMVVIKTMVSLDRLQEAQDAILNLLHTVADTITQQELDEAKNAIAQSLIGSFDMNAKMASAFLFLQKYGFDSDYFDHRARSLAAISLEEVKKAAKAHLHPEQMNVVRVGRVNQM